MDFTNKNTEEEHESFSQLDHSENIMTSCCSNSKTDKRLLIVCSQVGFSALTLIFAFFMIAKKNEDDHDLSTFYAIISSILSFWLGKSTDI